MAVPGTQVAKQIILDTNVIEYAFSPYGSQKKKAIAILDSIRKGLYDGILCTPVIMELVYRLSDNIGPANAGSFLWTLVSMPNMYVKTHTLDMALSAGEFYYRYNTISSSLKKPSAVDCLIAGMCKHTMGSAVCTNDGQILGITDIQCVPFWKLKTS